MDNFKEKALEISNRFQFDFGSFPLEVPALNGSGETNGSLSSVVNHLDESFMALLDKGAHLDTTKMPL